MFSTDWTGKLILLLADQSAATICRGLGSGLNRPSGHLQGSFLSLVPANKAGGMDEYATLNPCELRQGFVTHATPLFRQGQPGKGKQKGRWAYRWTLCGQLFSPRGHIVTFTSIHDSTTTATTTIRAFMEQNWWMTKLKRNMAKAARIQWYSSFIPAQHWTKTLIDRYRIHDQRGRK